ncbi:major facilitator superfamily MFS_1 [Desulfarculus baarsii DSM 2075]|uniref:Major facilitator superfamily MFS_1 n=1 Tax=Desulfarculus baarsii (strain ATCC 33931 / DSM 2075 / LMG 7858 / VKM B-1802 / 2st14) TaxID=644282 RepID=E1QEU7_DESB2|nr:MFS transporter [Desulfarculus baarsii]ADK84083.1 major facilitator superfamily MFS_1 [Desulfarculus baarsii DSM 2075]
MQDETAKNGRAPLADGNFRILMAVTFFAVIGVSSLTPALPLVMEAWSVHPAHIGWAVTAFALGGALGAPVSGVLADRLGRRRVLAPALLIFALGGAACGLAQSFQQLLALRFVQGLGAGPLNTLTFTMAGDAYEGRARVLAMGLLGMAISVGSATASIFGGLTALAGWRWVFVMPLLALGCWWLVQYRFDGPEPQKSADGLGRYLGRVLGLVASRPMAGLLAADFCVFALLFGAFFTYGPLMLHQRLAAAPHVIGLAMTVVTVFIGLASALVGRLTAWWGSRALIVAGFGLYGLAMFIMSWAASIWPLALALACLGLGHGLLLPSVLELLTALSPPQLRAALMSVNSLTMRLGQTVAPVGFGLLLTVGGLREVFWAGAALAVGAIVVVAACLGRAAGGEDGA